MFEEHETVGSIVAKHPSTARVFEARGVDYCCGGRRSLVDAANERGLDVREIAVELEQAAAGRTEEELNVSDLPLSELCEHIINRHHTYLRSELPRLERLIAKVGEVHGAKEPALHEIETIFLGLNAELSQHMQKEEMILFPLVQALDEGTTASIHCGSVQNPIARMVMEHDSAGEALARLRELSGGYTAPDWACNTYRTMLAGLAELEQDLHQHIHKENNILFPRAAAREAELLG